MQLEPDRASVLDRLCARLGASGARPRAILGCTYPFKTAIFAEILERIAKALSIDAADLGRIPVDVVCDQRLYRGHALDRRFRVHLYPHEQLFHPKLLMILLENEVIWISGSGNLTAAGYCSNREIALLHEPGDLKLPPTLRRLLAKLPGDAAGVIRDATGDGPRGSSRRGGRFVTSLDSRIGREFLSRAPRGAHEICILAPYFEQANGDDPLDRGWLDALRARFPDALFRVYLPLLETGRRPLVQGDRALFEAFRDSLRQLDSLRFYPVPHDPGPLHGKLVALVYRGTKGRRARILVGSPNPSRRALLLPGRNVETAWIADVKGSALAAFLDGLDVGESRPLEALRFEPPRRQSEIVWTALSCAALDPVTRTLSLTWVDGRRRQETDVFYGSRRLKVGADSCVHAFVLDAAHGAVTTRPKSGVRVPTTPKGKIVPGYCPIDVALADRMLLGAVEAKMSPEDWLALLGSDPGRSVGFFGEASSRGPERTFQTRTGAFGPSERVRDLAGHLRHTLKRLRLEPWSKAEREASFRVLRGIFASHDPASSGLATDDRIWRAWVRAEIIRFAAYAARDREVRGQGLSGLLRSLASELRGQLDLRAVPALARAQVRLVASDLP